MVPIDVFDTAAARAPDAPALVDGDIVWTFADVVRASHQLGWLIASLADGSEPTPVVVYSPNDYRFMVATVAVMRAGGVIVPIHASNPVQLTAKLLKIVEPRCLFYHSSLRLQVAVLRPQLQSVRLWICLDDGTIGDPDFTGLTTGDHVCKSTWIEPHGNRDRPVYYWSTSGTSGEPKVVIDDVVSFGVSLALLRELHAGVHQHVSLAVAPLSHGAGPHCFGILTLGGKVLIPTRFDPGAAVASIESHAVTDMWLPPTAMYLLLEYPGIENRDLGSLRHVWLGTMSVSAAQLRRAVEVLGPCISQTYGQIESGFVTALSADTTAKAAAGVHQERLASAGRSLSVSKVAIMDQDGALLPPGSRGEIVVRGMCLRRYWDDRQTREARRFGWHHTGDIGYLDEGGYLYIVGRLRDVVNVAGLKIPCAELEATIAGIAGVREVAVIPIPDALRGEVPLAVVTPVAGLALAPTALLEFCRQRLGPRSPVAVEFWSELPKSPAGKIDKHEIRHRVQMRATALPTRSDEAPSWTPIGENA